MPTIAEMILMVGVGAEFIKRLIVMVAKRLGAAENFDLTKQVKFALSLVTVVAVVGFHWIESGEPFTFNLLVILVQVGIGSTQGYNLLRSRKK